MQCVPINKEGYKLLHEGMIAFSDMQMNGIRIDTDYCKKMYDQLHEDIKKQEKKLYEYKEIKRWKKEYKSRFNLDSGKQLADILFDKFGYTPVVETKKENPATSKEALEALNLQFTDDLLQYRKLNKARNTYINNLIKETHNGYLHPFLNLHIPKTFRSSTQSPNTQNTPIRDPEFGGIIRRAFITRKNHYLVESDYGGIEVKGSSWYHKDPTMLGYLRNPTTADMHADFMQQIYYINQYNPECKGEKKLRKGTKNGFTFPQFYGDYYGNNTPILYTWAGLKGKRITNSGEIISSGITVGQNLINHGIKTYKQFEKHIQKMEDYMWRKRFPVYNQWKKDTYSLYLKQGFLTSLSGFTFQGVMDKNDAANYPIQSVSFHCLLWSIIRLLKLIKKYKMRTKLIFQIHDSVIADVPKGEKKDYYELLKQVMCHDLKNTWKFIICPLEIEVDSTELNGNWFKKETELHYIY